MKILYNIFKLKIIDKKLLLCIEKCNIIGFIFCLFSFLFTYYYFIILEKIILNIGIILFETGLSLVVGSLISAIIIDKQIN